MADGTQRDLASGAVWVGQQDELWAGVQLHTRPSHAAAPCTGRCAVPRQLASWIRRGPCTRDLGRWCSTLIVARDPRRLGTTRSISAGYWWPSATPMVILDGHSGVPHRLGALREGLEEMFTVSRLGHRRPPSQDPYHPSNPIESMISIARTTNRNVTRWRDGQMVLRWTAAGMLNAERSFRRIKGRKQMPQLVDALPPTRPPLHRHRRRICRCPRIEFTVDRHRNSSRIGTRRSITAMLTTWPLHSHCRKISTAIASTASGRSHAGLFCARERKLIVLA